MSDFIAEVASHLAHSFEVITFVLGLWALYLAVRAHSFLKTQKGFLERQSALLAQSEGHLGKQDLVLQAQRTRIEDIVLSVSTRYVGKFPESLLPVTDLIATAGENDKLVILVDYVGYGHYSAMEHFDKYLKEIKDAKRVRKASVRLLVYGQGAAKINIQAQFTRDGFAAIPEARLLGYLAHYGNWGHKDRLPSYEEFGNLLVAAHDQFRRQLFDEKIQVHVPLPSSSLDHAEAVYFWLIEKKEMIFAFPNMGDPQRGFAFKTRDDHLLDLFMTLFETKWQKSGPAENHWKPDTKLF